MRAYTNQKLGRARLLLAQLAKADDANLAAALVEAVLLESGLAYRYLLAELAAEHGLGSETAASAVGLSAELAAQQITVAELDELALLERRQAWPQKLLSVGQVVSPAMAKPAVAAKTDENLIAAVQVDEKLPNLFDYSDCLEIYQSLCASVEHLRTMTQQW